MQPAHKPIVPAFCVVVLFRLLPKLHMLHIPPSQFIPETHCFSPSQIFSVLLTHMVKYCMVLNRSRADSGVQTSLRSCASLANLTPSPTLKYAGKKKERAAEKQQAEDDAGALTTVPLLHSSTFREGGGCSRTCAIIVLLFLQVAVFMKAPSQLPYTCS